jgi:hypothetical protein
MSVLITIRSHIKEIRMKSSSSESDRDSLLAGLPPDAASTSFSLWGVLGGTKGFFDSKLSLNVVTGDLSAFFEDAGKGNVGER